MYRRDEARFFERMSQSPLFAEAINSATSIESAILIAVEHGVQVDASSVRAAAAIKTPRKGEDYSAELSDADLEGVSGGIMEDCGPISI